MTCQNSFVPDMSKISDNCFIQQIDTKCLAQYSYYIESDKKAAIIDPLRDISIYTDLLKSRGAKLLYVLETHFHADFVSGHVELADTTGAEIVFGPGAEAEFKIRKTKHGEIFDLSDKIKIELLHTPGHTLESSCFCLLEVNKDSAKNLAVFTGDTLFLGDVGRPDLAVKSNLTSKDLATMLFESIQLLKKLPDSCIVFPGHGAGSACGKNIQVGTASTMELQKKSNYALNDNLKKEEFIEIATANIPTPPQYFFFDAMMNKKSITHWEDILKKCLKPIDLKTFEKYLSDSSVKIIDSRSHKDVVLGFIKGTVTISLDMTYAIWAATLYKPDTKVVVVAAPGKEMESVSRLTRVGFENILGYLDGGIETWLKAKKPVVKLRYIEAKDTLKIAHDDPEKIIDVRNPKELACPGYIKNSQSIPLPTFEENIKSVNNKDTVYMLCKGGNRATIAASMLRNNNYENDIVVIEGGFDKLMKEGLVPTKKEN